ncbi:Tripartite tricarboxylate transporter family receptor [Mycobacteroides abscessus subsp. abscessus]|nr:Tripartite tricarboxylate transporter family receptor [Mycobacteroides abscessus subsp. abscessus]
MWHGLYAPKGTPPAVIDRLNAALRTALADPGAAKRLVDLGVVIPAAGRLTQETLSQHTAAETQRWGALIKKAGVKND